jgi:HK97 family phage portal protein
MSFWSFLKSSDKPSVPTEKIEERISASDPVSAEHWIVRLTDSLARAGLDVTGDGAMRQTAVFACVRVLSETIASLPLILYKRGQDDSKEPARDHYLYPMLHDTPNNFQTALEFFEMAVGHLCLRGNSYSFLERDGRNQIRRIVPFHPDRITPKLVDASRQILAYEYTDDTGKRTLYDAEDIWHLRGLSSDGFIGISPVEMARRAIYLAAVAEDHGATYFANGARASGIAKLPGILKADAKLRLQESLQKAMSGDNKFKVVVFEQGLDWTQLSLTNEDSQYLETRAFQVEEIARIFRVPAILIGHPDKSSTYASAEQFMMSFVVHTLRPWLVRIEQSINKYLLTDQERNLYFARFKLDALLRGDIVSRYAAYAVARQNKWMSANEIRALEEMNPIVGGDVYENPAIDKTGAGGSPDDLPGK